MRWAPVTSFSKRWPPYKVGTSSTFASILRPQILGKTSGYSRLWTQPDHLGTDFPSLYTVGLQQQPDVTRVRGHPRWSITLNDPPHDGTVTTTFNSLDALIAAGDATLTRAPAQRSQIIFLGLFMLADLCA
jgi:hypothetical protein